MVISHDDACTERFHMKRRLRMRWLTAALVIGAASVLAAQSQTRTQTNSNAVEVDPGDPRAKRAAALVTLLIGDDLAAAEKYWKINAVPGSPAATDVARQVKELRQVLASGLIVDRVIEGGR